MKRWNEKEVWNTRYKIFFQPTQPSTDSYIQQLIERGVDYGTLIAVAAKSDQGKSRFCN